MKIIITQFDIFDYMQIEELGDLERISMCFSQIPMQPLIDALNKDRKNGRNDYSNETMIKLLVVKKYVSLILLKSYGGSYCVILLCADYVD